MSRLDVRLIAWLFALGISIVCVAAEAGTLTTDSKTGSVASPGFLALLENPRDSSSLKVNADLFVKPFLSVGEATPILPDPTKSWQTVQARVWLNLSSSSRLFLQSGLGFQQADPLLPSPQTVIPPLLIPFGVGMGYPTDSGHPLTAMFSLNVSDLHSSLQTNPQHGPHVMPGLVIGIGF